MKRRGTALMIALFGATAPAQAADLFGGVYQHDVNIFAKKLHEGGTDLEAGYRGNALFGLGPLGGPAPYVLASVNTAGNTSFAAAGLAWKFGGLIYVRPGVGIAVHDGPSRRIRGNDRTDLGSRVLFEPEFAIGWQVLPRISVEASLTHLSHAQIFGKQNPGLDMLGLRVNFHLP
ncbi:acyloxyacyl hydrolase [Sphingomonas sp. BIUV-7]|uniref:Acyloxyacyl hydrolase n=1 Tax=Sphingomonas natans TaxID=3063330 RepID=A0ABT8YFD0_9SPHN|nr:acyloxyacyl hydrolase [Sphingomonas sp. BIUV-7]MDO6416429.1 acyloxyacyl hydrolase [Sphingomonas sp. BIUV-7]